MKVSNISLHDNDGYFDAYLYVGTNSEDDGEWKFSVSLDVECDTIYDGDPQFAENYQAMFEEISVEPPKEVLEVFQQKRAEMVALLEAKRVVS